MRPENRPRPEGPRRRRVFFALWPDESTRAALAKTTRRAVRAAGGRPTPRENLHITIAFLGGLEPDELDRARDVPPIRTGSFELTLDTLGYWARPRILWLSPAGKPDALAELERSLWDGLVSAGIRTRTEGLHAACDAQPARPYSRCDGKTGVLGSRATDACRVRAHRPGRSLRTHRRMAALNMRVRLRPSIRPEFFGP